MSPRADAQRNRARLVEAALAALTADPEATLDSIARRAGVGIGTLYRHFPTRETLVEAVYRSELERLCDRAPRLLDDHEPADALRTWMGRYLEFVSTKRGMADALRVVIASGQITSTQTRERLSAAIQTILDAGAASGTLRGDVLAEDLSASLAGVMLAAGAPEQGAQAQRMLDLLIDAVRAPAAQIARPDSRQ